MDALRRAAPRELQDQVTNLIRELLLTLRSLIDWYLERLDQPRREPEVEEIPIDLPLAAHLEAQRLVAGVLEDQAPEAADLLGMAAGEVAPLAAEAIEPLVAAVVVGDQ